MEMLSKKQKILIVVGGIIVLLVVGFYYFNSTKDVYNYENLETSEEEEIEEKNENETKIVIHVAGAVLNPGIVEVKENARIADVVEAAGGVTEDADINNVNLAYLVEDGQKIYIPSKTEIVEYEEDIETVVEGSEGAIVQEGEENNSKTDKINITMTLNLQHIINTNLTILTTIN